MKETHMNYTTHTQVTYKRDLYKSKDTYKRDLYTLHDTYARHKNIYILLYKENLYEQKDAYVEKRPI